MSPQPDANPLVAVVVVGHNEKPLVDDCLRSLRGVEHRPLQPIYVDNDSTDGSLDHLRREFPEVIALPSGGNVGYCGGNNVGIARALEQGAEYILVLNPDTVVYDPRFITTLVHYMQARPRVGKTGPKVYLREVGVVQNTILSWPSIAGSAGSFLSSLMGVARTLKSAEVTVPTEVPSLNGCCLMVRAAAFQDVGLYDAGFWCYVDEVDWDAQAERAGWARHYVPVESIVHLQKMSGYDFCGRANYYMKRNTALWYAKNGKWLSMLVWMVVTTVVACLRLIVSPLRREPVGRHAAFVSKLVSGYIGVVGDVLGGRLVRRTPVPGGVRALPSMAEPSR